MDLVSSIRKSGSRGGVNFSWDEVAGSAHRENYLGHSLKAPVGRWQKGRDLSWYAKGDATDDGPTDETDEERAARERREEIKRIKEAEEDALARALGLPVAPRDQTGANAVEVKNPRVGPSEQEEPKPAKQDITNKRHHRDSDRRHRRRHQSRSRSRDRKRERSPRRRTDHEIRRPRDTRHDGPRRRSYSRDRGTSRSPRRKHIDEDQEIDRRRMRRSLSRDRAYDRSHGSHRRDRAHSPRGEATWRGQEREREFRPRSRDRRTSGRFDEPRRRQSPP